MNNTRKIVLNMCYGGFSVSPKAALWLYEKGMPKISTPVEDYFNKSSFENELRKWKNYLNNAESSFFIRVFSPDEKFVINVRPEPRDHPLLVECVETFGKEANGEFAELRIVSIPSDVDWEIEEYDGREWISEKHRTWS